MAQNILDAVYGCLIGGAIGDALGAPAEGLYYQEICARHGRIEELLPYTKIAYSSGLPGSVTDDTTLSYYMCLSIARKGGRITPEDAAAIWMSEMNPDRFWSPDKVARSKLLAGINPRDAGRGNIPSACATMAMVPIGIINAGDPSQAYQDGFGIASINGDDFNRDAPATLAAAVAAAFAPGATVQTVLEAAAMHSSYLVHRAIELTLSLAKESGNVEAFKETFYVQMLDWWSRPSRRWTKERFVQGTSIETVPLVMAILYLCEGDANRCLVEGASMGRDADSIASLAGAIAGALQGANAIRKDWIEIVESANAPLFAEAGGSPEANFYWMAQRLVEALRREKRATQERAWMLRKILG